jgi:hypothetical protein
MFEIRSPRLTVAKLVVVKNDPGAELTLISPTLYDWASKDKGILFDEIISTRAAAVSFTAGAKAEVNTAAHLHVYLPNMNIPVSIQVLSMPGMTDCVNEILLGLDNLVSTTLKCSGSNSLSATAHPLTIRSPTLWSPSCPRISHYVHTTLRCSLHGDRTQRVRYFAIATLKPLPPAVFPTGDKSLFKPWWDQLEIPKVVERKYRCRYHDGKYEYTMKRWLARLLT